MTNPQTPDTGSIPLEGKIAEMKSAYDEGKTIQSNHNGSGWEDFVPQNQVDSPNFKYGDISNWRVKPDKDETIKSAKEILKPYVETPFRHTKIVEKDNALIAMEEYAAQFKKQPPSPAKSLDEIKDEVAKRHDREDFNILLSDIGVCRGDSMDWMNAVISELFELASQFKSQHNTGWVKVTPETLPKPGMWVACLNMSDTNYTLGLVNWVSKGRINDSETWNVKGAVGMTFQNSIPTHWMPLPTNPE